jgi:hypothetical protein
MSEVITQDKPVTSDKPAKATKRASTKLVPFSSVHVAYAKRANTDVTRAGKQNRGYMRANYETLVKVWPQLRKAGKVNRDGNRWPSEIPSNVADMIVKRTLPKGK